MNKGDPIYMINDGNDVPTETLFGNLPNVTDPSEPFKVTYVDSTDYLDFYN